MTTHLTIVAGCLLSLLLTSCVTIPPQNFANNSWNQPSSRAPISNPNPNFNPSPTPSPAPASSGNIESDSIYHINRFRATQGLPPVQSHPGLASLARSHSQNMRQRDKMDHLNFSKRSQFALQNYQMRSIAENVQSSWGTTPTAEGIIRQWENSPKHRDNMKGNFTYAGMGVSQNGNSIFSTLLLGQ